MIRCTASRGSGGVSCFAARSNRYVASPLIFRALGISHFSSAVNEEDVQNLYQASAGNSFEAGNGAAAPASNPRDFLLSPLMDLKVKEARERFLQPKVAPSRNPTLFQQQLAKNPYALALSTPVRRCAVTKIAMPNYFLQDFSLISDPATGNPWYMPRSLTKKRHSPQEYGPESNDSIGSDESNPRNQLSNSPTPTLGPRVYTLSRKFLLRSLVTKKSGYEKQWQRFPTQRMMAVRRFIDIKHKLSWREDMDDFVLELMRRRAVENLTYIVNLKGRYLSGTTDWESALKKPQTGAFLWLGKGIKECENTSERKNGKSAIPPEFATLQLGKTKRHKVPVHNLLLLLGEKHLEELRTAHRVFGDSEILAVRNRNLTIELQLQLWKLQGYLATHENIPEE